MAFDVEITTDTTQNLMVLEQRMDQEQKHVFRFRCTVQGRDQDGNWLLSQKVQRYQLDVTHNGARLPFAQNVRLANFRQALVGSEFTVTLSPQMKAVRTEGRDQFANKLAGIDPKLQSLLEPCFGEALHKQLAEVPFHGTPPKAVRRGDSWARDSTIDLGQLGWLQVRHRCTYDGEQGQLGRITEELTLTNRPPTVGTSELLPFRIKNSELTSTSEASALLLFDPERGRLVSSDTYLDLKGKLVIEIGGMATEVELNQTHKTVVRLIDVPGLMK
jgi:hypothetical protein